MRRHALLVALVGVSGLVGCQGQVLHLLSGREVLYDVSTSETTVERGHHYIWYPRLEIYYCGEHGEWSYAEGGVWRTSRELPRRFVVNSHTPFAEIPVVGPAPWRFVEEHRRLYPSDWKPVPNKRLNLGKVKIR